MATTTNTTAVHLHSRHFSHCRGTRTGRSSLDEVQECEHAAGRITRPLRHNGQAYRDINVIQLRMTAETAGFISPFWLTFQQAREWADTSRRRARHARCLRQHVQKKEENAQVEEISSRRSRS